MEVAIKDGKTLLPSNPQSLIPNPSTCWLYLLRHGATGNNTARPPRLQGRRTDPGLSEAGFEQARRTARRLAGQRLDAVYSSPLLRARQTAEAIAAPHDLTVQTLDELIEVDVGQWEGRAWEEIEQTDAEAYRLFMADASIHPYLGGDNLAAVQRRVVPALERLMAENLGRLIVAVAHNVVNRCYLAHLLDVPLAEYRAIIQENCGINLIHCDHGRIAAAAINSVEHLREE